MMEGKMRVFFITLVLISCGAIQAIAAESNRILDELSETQVDHLTFGIQSLEFELRQERLSTCQHARCEDDGEKIEVLYIDAVSAARWRKYNLPAGGAIIISYSYSNYVRETGREPPRATEEDCKFDMEGKTWSLSKLAPAVSLARFFLPRSQWKYLYGRSGLFTLTKQE